MAVVDRYQIFSSVEQGFEKSPVNTDNFSDSILNPEDIQLLHFLAEYGYIYLKNLKNIYPCSYSVNILEEQKFISRRGNAICLDERGIKRCGHRFIKCSIPSEYIYMNDIKRNIITKIASEFVREGFTVSEHDPSDYMFLQSRVAKGKNYGLANSSSAIGLVLGKGIRAGVFYLNKEFPAEKHRQAMQLHKIGIDSMIFLAKRNICRTMKIETPRGKTHVYYISRNKKGYEKIKSIISLNPINELAGVKDDKIKGRDDYEE